MRMIRISYGSRNIFSCIFGHHLTADMKVFDFCVELNEKDIVCER
jgi:hypothetical protein